MRPVEISLRPVKETMMGRKDAIDRLVKNGDTVFVPKYMEEGRYVGVTVHPTFGETHEADPMHCEPWYGSINIFQSKD